MVDLTKKGKKFVWTVPCFDGGEFILDVDSSDKGIGGILHQFQGDYEKVIAYAIRSLNKAERNYCIREKELLAVRYFIEYLIGVPK